MQNFNSVSCLPEGLSTRSGFANRSVAHVAKIHLSSDLVSWTDLEFSIDFDLLVDEKQKALLKQMILPIVKHKVQKKMEEGFLEQPISGITQD